jgi:hypothetical protein
VIGYVQGCKQVLHRSIEISEDYLSIKGVHQDLFLARTAQVRAPTFLGRRHL